MSCGLESMPVVGTDRLTQIVENIRHYNEIETEEKRVLNLKISELKEQLSRYKQARSRNFSGTSDMSPKTVHLLQNEAKTLKFQVKTLEADKEMILKESAKFKQEITALKNEKFEKINEITSLKVRLNEVEDKIKNSVENKYRNYKRLVKNLRIENEQLQQRFNELSAVNKRLNSVNSILRQENETLKSENTNLKMEVQRLKNGLGDISFSNAEDTTMSSNDSFTEDSAVSLSPGEVRANNNLHLSTIPRQRIRYKKDKEFEELKQLRDETQKRPKRERRRVPEAAPSLNIRFVGRHPTLKQCCFKVQSAGPTTLYSLCSNYCSKFGLSMGSLSFGNYRGETLDLEMGTELSNGDLIYVNYR